MNGSAGERVSRPDDIDIRSGGLVAVDTDALDAAAARYADLEDRVRRAADDLAEQSRRLGALAVADMNAPSLASSVRQSSWRAWTQADDLAEIAADLRSLAATYEIVDQRVRVAVASAAGERMRLSRQLTQLEARHPDAAHAADTAMAGWHRQVGMGVTSFSNAGALLPVGVARLLAPLAVPDLLVATAGLVGAGQLLQQLLRTIGGGTIEPGDRLRGAPPPVDLIRTVDAVDVAAPTDLAAAIGRIPDDDGDGGGDARIRIETYTMPDGTTRYAVYLAGTRDFWPGGDGDDPWDLASDLQLYFGQDAAAYEAVQAALADAGAAPGDQVYLFGHSQGGMMADLLAMQGGYDARLLVTAGSPTEAAVGPDTLSVQLRNTDDLVQSLAAGGSPSRVGAPGSLVVGAVGDPKPTLGDLTFAAHHLPTYVGLARALDASSDPRTGALRERLGELQGATSVRAREYDARRPAPLVCEPAKPSPSPRPNPAPSPRAADR